MRKIKFKRFKTFSIVFIILGIIYVSIRYLAKSIISVDKVCHKDTCFIVEIAKTDQERQKGLMYRKNLSKNRGMFFVFEEQKIYPFWMKNTLIPLDILWINKNFEIVDIKTAIPCTTTVCLNYLPKGEAKYVLEINAGLAEDYGIQINDFLEIKINNL